MTDKRLGRAIAFCVLLVAPTAFATDLDVYIERCKQDLEFDYIEAYNCSDGEVIENPNSMFISEVKATLGKAATDNPLVDAIYLCRGHAPGDERSRLNGLIISHRATGETCFFDAKRNTYAQTVALTSHQKDEVNDYWRDPDQMAGLCTDCHTTDPYVVSPPLAQAFKDVGSLYNGRDLFAPYMVVGDDLLSKDFTGSISRAPRGSGCAGTCHYMVADESSPAWAWQDAAGQIDGSGFMMHQDNGVWQPGSSLPAYQPISDPITFGIANPPDGSAPAEINKYHNIQSYGHRDLSLLGWWTGQLFAWTTDGYESITQWFFEKEGDYVRIRSGQFPNQYLRGTYSSLSIEEVDAAWNSALWKLEPLNGWDASVQGKVFRIRNKFSGMYLRVLDGELLYDSDGGVGDFTSWWIIDNWDE